MKTFFKTLSMIAAAAMIVACGETSNNSIATSENETEESHETAGQSAVSDDISQKNVVQVAAGSADHTTLVKAVTTAGLADVLSNVGPFTVFAPVNSAFEALPAGTVENLLKPENKAALSHILEYHVYVGVIKENMIQDGMKLNQVNGQDITLNKTGDEIIVNGAKITAAIPAANGIIYVIDKVLLPPDKK